MFALNRSLSRDSRQNLGLQNCQQVGLAARAALVGQEDLKSLPRQRRGARVRDEVAMYCVPLLN